jgi:hypothetical protein
MYQEVLLLAETEEIIKYLEAQLEKAGIFEKKADIDKDFQKENKHESNFSVDDNFLEKFVQEKDADNSFVSSISSEGKSRCVGSSWVDAFEPFQALK